MQQTSRLPEISVKVVRFSGKTARMSRQSQLAHASALQRLFQTPSRHKTPLLTMMDSCERSSSFVSIPRDLSNCLCIGCEPTIRGACRRRGNNDTRPETLYAPTSHAISHELSTSAAACLEPRVALWLYRGMTGAAYGPSACHLPCNDHYRTDVLTLGLILVSSLEHPLRLGLPPTTSLPAGSTFDQVYTNKHNGDQGLTRLIPIAAIHQYAVRHVPSGLTTSCSRSPSLTTMPRLHHAEPVDQRLRSSCILHSAKWLMHMVNISKTIPSSLQREGLAHADIFDSSSCQSC